METTQQHAESYASAEPDKILEAKTTEVTDLQRLIRAVEHTIQEASFTFSDTGIQTKAVDSSMVSMADLALRPEFFDYYQFNRDRHVEIGVNMGELKKKVGQARKGDTLTLFIKEKQGRGRHEPHLYVEVDNDGVVSTFELEHQDLSEEDKPDTSGLEFSGSVIVSLEKLKDAVDRIDEHARFRLRENQLTIVDDGDFTKVSFPESSNHARNIQLEDGELKSNHSTDYLDTVSKLKHTVDELRVCMGNDFPIKFEAVQTLSFRFSYIVAPRIEE